MNAALLLAIAGLALLATPSVARALALYATDPRRAVVVSVPPPASSSSGPWQPPLGATPYLEAILRAESLYNLPHLLLARVLYQESRFRQDVILGITPSPRGAIGIAQFMPDTAAELGVDPFDPYSSIDGAGLYLAGLFDQFGDWTTALAAYNWGMGNVRRKGISKLPPESIAYATAILTDVGTFA